MVSWSVGVPLQVAVAFTALPPGALTVAEVAGKAMVPWWWDPVVPAVPVVPVVPLVPVVPIVPLVPVVADGAVVEGEPSDVAARASPVPPVSPGVPDGTDGDTGDIPAPTPVVPVPAPASVPSAGVDARCTDGRSLPAVGGPMRRWIGRPSCRARCCEIAAWRSGAVTEPYEERPVPPVLGWRCSGSERDTAPAGEAVEAAGVDDAAGWCSVVDESAATSAISASETASTPHAFGRMPWSVTVRRAPARAGSRQVPVSGREATIGPFPRVGVREAEHLHEATPYCARAQGASPDAYPRMTRTSWCAHSTTTCHAVSACAAWSRRWARKRRERPVSAESSLRL